MRSVGKCEVSRSVWESQGGFLKVPSLKSCCVLPTEQNSVREVVLGHLFEQPLVAGMGKRKSQSTLTHTDCS